MRKLGALAFAVAFAAAAFVVIEGAASSASDAPLWRWQGAIERNVRGLAFVF